METDQGKKQRASHTPDSTVFPVGDKVPDKGGDDTSVYCSTCTAVASIQDSVLNLNNV